MSSFVQMLLLLNYSNLSGDPEDDFRPFIEPANLHFSEGRKCCFNFLQSFLYGGGGRNLDINDLGEGTGKSDRETESVGLFMLKLLEIFFQSSSSL